MPVTARIDVFMSALDVGQPIMMSTNRWSDEGRAAAMHGLSWIHNPYRFHSEHAQHDAWIEGLDSFPRQPSRRSV